MEAGVKFWIHSVSLRDKQSWVQKAGGIVLPERGRFGGERGAALREQGVLGECGTMTRACRETPGGAGGVANDDPALGVQRGGASSGPADGPWRAREGGEPPERRDSAVGVRGRSPRRTTAGTQARRAGVPAD